MDKKGLKYLYIITIIFFLYIPLLLLVAYSFNNSQYSIQWTKFSLRWFYILWEDDELWSSLKNSLLLGFFSASIATILSVIACTVVVFNKQKKSIARFLMMPSFLVILPDLILGVGFMLILNLLQIPFGFISLMIAHITFCTPFIIFTIFNQINQFNKNLYFAALDLGASKFITWQKIILPLLFPTILSAFLLSFTLSFDDVVISYFVAGPEFNILPLTILANIRSGSTPELNALCTLTLLFSFILIVITQRKLRKNL